MSSSTAIRGRRNYGEFLGGFVAPSRPQQFQFHHLDGGRFLSLLPHVSRSCSSQPSGSMAAPPNRPVKRELVGPSRLHPNQLFKSVPVMQQGARFHAQQTGAGRKREMWKRLRNRRGEHSSVAGGESVRMTGKNIRWGGLQKQGVKSTRTGQAQTSNNSLSKKLAKRGLRPWELPQLQDSKRRKRGKTQNLILGSLLERPGTVPPAPRNTSSYIMRANRLGITAPAMDSPATPAVLPTPCLSPATWQAEAAGERQFVEEAKAVKVVDFYGTMNSYIRLRTPDPHAPARLSETRMRMSLGADEGVSGEATEAGVAASGVQQLEQRVDQDLLRFEMLYSAQEEDTDVSGPSHADNGGDDMAHPATADVRDLRIASLEEENLELKEKLSVMLLELEVFRHGAGDGDDRGAVESSDGGEEVSHAPQNGNCSC